MIREMMAKFEKFQMKGSNWFFKKVIRLEIHTVEYNPLGGSSFIPRPDFIVRKKAIININNHDEKCFLCCVLRYPHPVERRAHRITDLRQYENELNTQGIDFPVKVKDIYRFESLNPTISGINVFSVNEHNKFCPLRMAQRDTKKQWICFFMKKTENSIIHLLNTLHVCLDPK